MEPLKDVSIRVLDDHNKWDTHVFWSEGTVYKMYDTEHYPALAHNIEAIQQIKEGSVPGLSLENMTENGHA